jgi:hypothetical protein
VKQIISLLALVLLPLSAHADTSQAPPSSAPILVIPTSDGCDITLPPSDAKTVVDRMYLVIDGKSEDLVAWYNPNARRQTKSIHYLATAVSDIDRQVKDILTAQGLLTKPDFTTYHIAAGIGVPVSGGGYFPEVATLSKTLHFAHGSGDSVNVNAYANKTLYKVGDKIPVLDEVVLDSDTTVADALGPNKIESGKFVALPPGQMHRITIQVQFAPKTPGTP